MKKSSRAFRVSLSVSIQVNDCYVFVLPNIYTILSSVSLCIRRSTYFFFIYIYIPVINNVVLFISFLWKRIRGIMLHL